MDFLKDQSCWSKTNKEPKPGPAGTDEHRFRFRFAWYRDLQSIAGTGVTLISIANNCQSLSLFLCKPSLTLCLSLSLNTVYLSQYAASPHSVLRPPSSVFRPRTPYPSSQFTPKSEPSPSLRVPWLAQASASPRSAARSSVTQTFTSLPPTSDLCRYCLRCSETRRLEPSLAVPLSPSQSIAVSDSGSRPPSIARAAAIGAALWKNPLGTLYTDADSVSAGYLNDDVDLLRISRPLFLSVSPLDLRFSYSVHLATASSIRPSSFCSAPSKGTKTSFSFLSYSSAD